LSGKLHFEKIQIDNMLTTTTNIFRFLQHFGFKTHPLSIALVFLAQIAFLPISTAQITGPCGLTLTVTNTSNTYTNDGKLTVTGLLRRVRLWVVKPDGTTIGMGEYSDVTSAPTQYLTGLLSGTYTLYYERYSLSTGALQCSGNQAFTVASGALPTCATTEIGGFVFHDFNANGTRDNSDAGATGITVNAYNAANTLAATTTSSSTGAYKLTGLTVGQPYRLEFSWSDGYIESGALGANSTSSVQFVDAGTCAANFSVNLPSSYCQTSNPLVMLPCYVNGSDTAAAVKPMDALVAFPYNAYSRTDVSTQSPTVSHIATVGQVGAMWAMAYQKTSKVMFGGAVLRRYSGFGALGTGGIYKIDMTNPTTPSVAPWVDVKTIGIPTGTDTRNGTPANTLSLSPGSPAWDAEAFNQIGKLGIGGMDFNDRGDTLWLVNMADRKLYGLKNVNPSVTPTAANVVGGYSIALPSGYACASGAGDFRPWAIKYYKGLVYIGALCSGESTQWTPANLRGYILSFDPANPAAGFKHVANFPLDYSRRHYGTSTNVFQSWINNSFYNDYIIQPIVTDLEFDIDGSIIVGISDRGGLQMGNQNYRADPSASDYTLTNGDTYGDILRICRVGSSFVAEGNAGCAYPTNPFGTTEFYWGDHAPFAGSQRDFMDNAAGALAFTQGNGTFISTMQDAAIWNSGGVTAFSPISGGDVRRYTVYDPSVPGAAGKATGLGDIEPLCDPAPIEIGNRVWTDSDQDGIQDAGEPGISGVTVKLYNVTTGVLVATATTDASGHYKFTNLTISTQYRIEISMSDPFVGGKNLTNRDAGANDLIDNDAQSNAGIASITLTTKTYGQNNHSYDFGFNPCNNVTAAGTIGTNQSACTSLDPALFTSSVDASGGSGGSIEYQWYKSTTVATYLGNEAQWTLIAGATSTTYDAPSVSATTYFVRLAKRTVCTNWLAANIITITITPVNFTVSAGNSGTICTGGTVALTASATLINNNLVQNDDFTSGNVGFQSDFQYTTTGQGCGTGYYSVGNPNMGFSWAPNCTPTTGASTQMMYIDNAGNSAPDKRAWFQTIPVQPNTNYTFQTYAASISGSNPARIYLSINGTSVSSVTTLSTTTCQWVLVQGTWNSGSNTSATVAIVNQNGDCSGNDYALDKISFAVSSIAGGTWAWTGPSGYNSTTQNPSVINAVAGVYTATYTLNGCSNAATTTVSVVADPTVSVVASATGVCVGGNVTLNATPSGGVGTCVVQWQSSPDGSTWSPISGATGNTYVTPALSALARYRAQVNCSGNGCCN
jgi:hypothetical protein